MQVRHRREYRLLAAVSAGVLVWTVSFVADLVLLPLDRTMVSRQLVANFIAGLMTVIVSLAIQLNHEEGHYRVTMERATIMAELNHHVRNAVFPLCIAIQKFGNPEASRIADEATERINLALRDATADALSGRIDYSTEAASGNTQQ